jgi:tetratricopeptide (TPR) repeat protein
VLATTPQYNNKSYNLKLVHHTFKNLFKLFLLSTVLFYSACKSSKNTANNNVTSKYEQGTPENKKFEKLFFDGNREKILGNKEQAIIAFRNALTIEPNNAATNFELAELALESGEIQIAKNYNTVAYKTFPDNKWYAIQMSQIHVLLKEFEQSNHVLEELIKTQEQPEYYVRIANNYLALNKTDKAIEWLNKLEQKFGQNENIAYEKAKIYIKSKRFDDAIEIYKKLLEKEPNNASYYCQLGEIYLANNLKEKAEECYNKAELYNKEKDIIVLININSYYRQSLQKEKFEKTLLELIQNDVLDINYKLTSLNSYFYTFKDTANKEYMNELFSKFIQTNSENAIVYAAYGDYLYNTNLLKEAQVQYLKAAELDKSKYEIYNQILIIDSQLNKADDMLKHSNTAIELFPNQPLPYLLNGMATVQNKDYTKAIEVYSKGVEYVVQNKTLKGQFYANLGDAYYQQKMFQQSDSCYDKALLLNPNDSYVLNNYSYYLSLRKEKLDQAEKMSKKSLDLEPNNSNFFDTYAWILYGQKKYDEAKLWMEKALEKDGYKNSVLIEHYGDILYRLNDKEKAFEFWEKAKKTGKTSDVLEKKISQKTLIE